MKTNHKVVGVIPARMESQRLPGKVLLDIAGKPMLQWVYERSAGSELIDDLLVATDSVKIGQFCNERGIPVMITARHSSGTDRLYEVMERTEGSIYVNIQGDEPTIRPEHIELLLRPLLDKKAEVTTLKVPIDARAAQDPNVVKVVSDLQGRALYFSRAPIPFERDAGDAARHCKHIGLYGYTRSALSLFHRLPQTPLELCEKLEQLRFLENGIPILVAATPYDTVGVDTQADLEKAAMLLRTDN